MSESSHPQMALLQFETLTFLEVLQILGTRSISNSLIKIIYMVLSDL